MKTILRWYRISNNCLCSQDDLTTLCTGLDSAQTPGCHIMVKGLSMCIFNGVASTLSSYRHNKKRQGRVIVSVCLWSLYRPVYSTETGTMLLCLNDTEPAVPCYAIRQYLRWMGDCMSRLCHPRPLAPFQYLSFSLFICFDANRLFSEILYLLLVSSLLSILTSFVKMYRIFISILASSVHTLSLSLDLWEILILYM